MKVLGIETSCDETAAAVIEDGQRMLSNVVASSVDLHKAYGGVVPEIAARSHLEVITPVIEEALEVAKCRWQDIDAIAVTQGPGLGGSLLIGVLTARTLAIAKQKPLYAINHVEAHIYANFITETPLPNYQLPAKPPTLPLLALIVSGGHSHLIYLKNHSDYEVIGRTYDDAVGEAFDKVAKILGLPYPGGPSVGQAALKGNPSAFSFPKAKSRPRASYARSVQGDGEQRTEVYGQYSEGVAQPSTQQWPASASGATGYAGRQASALRGLGKYDFSFSGLKTAVLRAAQAAVGRDFTLPSHELPNLLTDQQKADFAASFQETALSMLIDKLSLAIDNYSPASVVIGGGVAASQRLREMVKEQIPTEVSYTDIKLCTDNAAMVATLAYFKTPRTKPADPYSLEIDPNLSM